MAQIKGRSEELKETPIQNLVPVEFAEIGKKRIETMMKIQKELFERFEELNRAWFTRAKSEASLVADFVTKLTAARSAPETATACQECMDKRMELLAEDSRRLFDDSQKFLQMGTQLLMNGSAADASKA